MPDHSTGDESPETEGAWVPADACTLPTVEQPLRVAAFDTLFATALHAIERPDSRRARLVFTGDASLARRVRRLTEAESSCCSFFTFTVEPRQRLATGEEAPVGASGPTAVEVTIEVPAARAEVLDALVIRAEQARKAAS